MTESPNGAVKSLDQLTVEEKIDFLTWLHAEQDNRIQRLALAMAGLLAQAYQPQMQKQIVDQLLGGG
jgi:hypothetical protein